MPIYEYRCTSCERVVEAIQKMDDAPLERCEACSGRLEKIISRSAFQLKGGGWFNQGYGGGASSPASEKAPGSTGPEGSGASKDTPKKAAGGSCGSGCGCH